MKYLSFVAALCLGVLLSEAHAATTELTLEEALQKTLKNNPELLEYDYKIRAAAAMVEQAEFSPNPTLSAEVENLAGSGEFGGISNAQLTVSFSQLIELGDKRQLRVDAATANEKAQQAEYEYRRVEVLAEATQRFYEVLKLQQLALISARQLERTERLLTIAKERVSAGAVPKSEVIRIQLELERQYAFSDELKGKLKQQKVELASMWAGDIDFDLVSGRFAFPLALPARGEVLTAVNRAPEYLRLLDSEQLLQAQANALKADSVADVTVGIGARYDNQLNDAGFTVQASMPLQLSNPNVGRIKQRRILYQSNLAQQKQVRQQLKSVALSLVHSLHTHQDYLQKVTQRLLPLSEQLLEQTRQGYARGTHSLLQVLDAQTELAKLEYEKLSRAHAIYSDMIQLERMTGQPFLGVQP
ncbi:MAG: TolC family protein [Pseudidiomarina maritima]|uniref:TolC family protein n=1 Tax=Pseudidiomarina sp. PP-1MA TaxID=3237706 RepID=A0AB39XAZ7_9GAMM|nr:TolC family protein [Pseudidiomarina maritima]PHS55436.1 MAG: cobalt transporter [Alcanivorax sp.]